MSKKLCSPLASDPNSLHEAQRRQLAENLGSLLAREWLSRRAPSHPALVKLSPGHGAHAQETLDDAASAGHARTAPPPSAG